MSIEVRNASLPDKEVIASFQEEMALETEGLRLDAVQIRAGIVAVFQDKSKGRYFVAENDGEIIASLLITFEWSDWRNAWVYWIQSVFVKKSFRRQGVYRKMYAHIKALALADKSVGGIRLYVDKTNTNAQKTYSQLGMNGAHYQVFEWMKDF
ncbi:MAG: GNAT family N-acetyltransferase [Bacteroidales bacterium]|nr:GNAT family N-acetyltransferase [Bacteroidales bacterium]